MKKSTVVLGAIGSIALLLPLSLIADHHEEAEAAPPTLSDVWIVVPKAGMEDEFFAGIAADKELREKGNDSRSWGVYTVVLGDNTNRVAFRACCFDWGDEDAYTVEEEEKGFNNMQDYPDHGEYASLL